MDGVFRVTCASVTGAAILACGALASPGTGDATLISGQVHALVQKYAEGSLFNGSILVAKDDAVLLEKGYGMANFEWNIPNTSDTRFRLGSLTKQFTSMLILQLVDKGELSLDDALASRLPYYRQDTGGRVTIHHLLSHTSGIPSYTDNTNALARSRLPIQLKELVCSYCSGDLAFEPGTKFAYSNSGYVLLGAIIEQVTGMSYEHALRERIFQQLGMSASGFDHAELLIPRRAAGYENGPQGMRNADFVDMSQPHAAGAVYSTVQDLYRWDRALYGTNLLSESSLRQMFTPGLGNYGYGWYVRQAPAGPDKAQRTALMHTGVIHGFSSLILRIPDERVLVVLLNNTGRVNLVAIAQGIVDVLYGREPPVPSSRQGAPR